MRPRQAHPQASDIGFNDGTRSATSCVTSKSSNPLSYVPLTSPAPVEMLCVITRTLYGKPTPGYNQKQRAGVVQWQNWSFPSFGLGQVHPAVSRISNWIWEAVATPSIGGTWKLWVVGSIPTAPTITPDDSVALTLLGVQNRGRKQGILFPSCSQRSPNRKSAFG